MGILSAVIRLRYRVLLCVALANVALYVTTAAQAHPRLPPTQLTLPGLERPGEIIIDSEGIPHITARSVRDGCLLLGYMHARDRFWQLDSNRRTADGTLAELLGPDVLETDAFLRTMRLRDAAEASQHVLEAETADCLEAYAKGVNGYILELDNPLPEEYGALELTRASIRPWDVVDSLLILKLLAWRFSFSTVDLDRSNDVFAYFQAGTTQGFDGQALYFEDVARVAPFDPDRAVSIPDFFSQLNDVVAASAKQRGVSYSVLNALATWQPYPRKTASNWVVIGSQHTTHGSSLLANDVHLTHTVPSNFYEFHLRVTGHGGFNISAGGAPGAGINIAYGQTDVWASGITIFPVDAMDIYQEVLILDPESGVPTHVLFEGEQVPLTVVSESLRANQFDGIPDNVIPVTTRNVRIVPHHGPLLAVSGTTGFSFRAVFLDAARDANVSIPRARARTPEAFAKALQNVQDLFFNIAYIDIKGNIGYFTTGAIPLREDLQRLEAADGNPPILVRDGTHTRQHEWLPLKRSEPFQTKPYELLPFEEMPQALNPDSGYILSANNDPVGVSVDNNPFNQLRTGGGVYYLNDFYADRRVSRLHQLVEQKLAKGGKITVNDMQEIQADNVERTAEFFVPHIVQALANATAPAADRALSGIVDREISEAVARMAAWDFTTPSGIQAGYDAGDDPDNLPKPSPAEIDNSVATTLYYTWISRFSRNVIDDTLAELGLQPPGGPSRRRSAFSARLLKVLLEDFEANQGVGAGGVDFFMVPGIPAAEDRRDFLILKSLRDALDDLSSDAFAAAFASSTNQKDYRWGLLHRIVFPHQLGGPFNIPPAGGFRDLDFELLGIAKGGGEQTVDTADCEEGFGLFGTDDCMFSRGPQNRFIAQAGGKRKKITARNILPGGQSGDVTDPLYTNQLGRWLTNQYRPVWRRRSRIRRDAMEIIRVKPKRPDTRSGN